MADTKDVLAKRVAGEDLITDAFVAGGGTLAVVFKICGVVCTMGTEVVFPKEFTIFVELFRQCFIGCSLKKLLDASVIFWVGLSTCIG